MGERSAIDTRCGLGLQAFGWEDQLFHLPLSLFPTKP